MPFDPDEYMAGLQRELTQRMQWNTSMMYRWRELSNTAKSWVNQQVRENKLIIDQIANEQRVMRHRVHVRAA